MVRLKVVGATMQPDNTLFQFHYGTIKRRKHRVNDSGVTLFQFHYGTIKSRRSFSVMLLVIYFNSTMVRLKA